MEIKDSRLLRILRSSRFDEFGLSLQGGSVSVRPKQTINKWVIRAQNSTEE